MKNWPIYPPWWLRSMFPSSVWKIPTHEKVLFLTFDDGPIPEITPEILDLLKQYNARATFFCVGDNVVKYPDLFQQLIANGHAVGNHTFHHLRGLKTPTSLFIQDVRKAAEVIPSRMFRPPHGFLRIRQYRKLKKEYRFILWDVITIDYDPLYPKEQCVRNVLKYASPGSIISMHDSLKAKENVLFSLPKILEHYSQLGYRFDKIRLNNT